jgi:hypothetical protein
MRLSRPSRYEDRQAPAEPNAYGHARRSHQDISREVGFGWADSYGCRPVGGPRALECSARNRNTRGGLAPRWTHDPTGSCFRHRRCGAPGSIGLFCPAASRGERLGAWLPGCRKRLGPQRYLYWRHSSCHRPMGDGRRRFFDRLDSLSQKHRRRSWGLFWPNA